MTTFDYFGFRYKVTNEEKKEVKLVEYTTTQPQGRVVIPHTVEYKGVSYKVTAIGSRDVKVYKWFDGIREPDKRRKNFWKEGQEPKWVFDYNTEVSPFVYHDGKGKNYDEIFRINTTMTSIVLPDTIKSIGICAFRRCSGLKEINLPITTTFISFGAFIRCKSLEIISLPENVKMIGNNAFWGCTSLKNISLQEGITLIGANAFLGCTALKEITIPSSVKAIDNCAFGDSTQSKCGLEIVNIMNDEGNVVIHPNAFNPHVKINYLGKNGVAQKSNSSDKTEKAESKTPVSINLDELIKAVIADGTITEKERGVILKKATATGYDADEVEILLDGKLAEKQNANKVETIETKKKAEPEKKKDAPTAKSAAKPAAAEGKSSEGTRVKYEVNGTGSYGKGRMVEAVVNKYVELNPKTTVQKLKEVFPEHLQGSNFIKDSTETITDMKRYYESALPNGEKFYISNQWGTQTDGFVEYVNNNIDGITVTKL